MIVNDTCVQCLTDKWLGKCPADAAPDAAAEYRRRVHAIMGQSPRASSPELDCALGQLREAMFGREVDYGPVKAHFNALLMAMEPDMFASAMAAKDPLRRAVQYAMAGNFIDFAAMDSVDEGHLRRLIAESDVIPIEDGLLSALRRATVDARGLTYILDNCGEIVMDRVLMRVLRQINPDLAITAVVKGGPIVNDATREDAGQARLDEIAAAIVDTGCAIAGVPEGRISPACRGALDRADVLIAKGQANYETLCGCGRNLYYIFMCKCRLFTERFGVPLYSGVIAPEDGRE